MADETAAVDTSEAKVGEALATGEPPPKRVVDLDAGESFTGETVAFDYPFKLGGVAHTGATVRMPTGADVEKYLGVGVTFDTLAVLTAFTGLSVEALQKMAALDYKKLDRTVGKLLWGSISASGTT
jgi:hypothetical protein